MQNFEIYPLKFSSTSKITWHAICSFTDEDGKEIHLYARCYADGKVKIDKEYTKEKDIKGHDGKVQQFLETAKKEWGKKEMKICFY